MTPKEQSVALLRSAGRALGTGDFAGALEVLQHARALDPSSPALADLTAMAEGQRAVAETRAKLRAQFREHLDAAVALLTRHDLAAASARVVEALRLHPGDPEARAIQVQIARQMDEARVAAVAAGRPGASPARADRAREAPPGPPVANPAAPGRTGDVRAKPDSEPRAPGKPEVARKNPANDESDLQES